MLNKYNQIRASVKSYKGKIHTKALFAREAKIFMQASKARQNHLGSKVALIEGVLITSALISYYGIYIAARLS